MKIIKAFLPLLLVVLFAAFSAVSLSLAAPPKQEPTKFIGDVAVTDDVTVGDDLTVGGIITTDDLTVTGSLAVSDGIALILGSADPIAIEAAFVVSGSQTVSDSLTVGLDLSAGDDLAVTDDAIIGGGLTVTESATAADLIATDDVTVGDDLTVGGFTIRTSQSITPTDGAAITPTTSLVLLTPAGEVTPTVSACAGGEMLILYNAANQTINLADSGNFILTGALALTQYDTLPLVCVATKWVQIGPVSAN